MMRIDFTGVTLCYWTAELMQTSTSLQSDAFLAAAVSFCCLFCYWEESVQYIFTYSSKRRSSSAAFCSEELCVSRFTHAPSAVRMQSVFITYAV